MRTNIYNDTLIQFQREFAFYLSPNPATDTFDLSGIRSANIIIQSWDIEAGSVAEFVFQESDDNVTFNRVENNLIIDPNYVSPDPNYDAIITADANDLFSVGYIGKKQYFRVVTNVTVGPQIFLAIWMQGRRFPISGAGAVVVDLT